MAELLIKVDPACLAANEQAGHVVIVNEDDFSWSELERKLFVIVRVPIKVDEAIAKYLKDGIPDNVKQAVKDAPSADKYSEISKSYLSRAVYFDMTQIPQKAVDVVLATRKALTDIVPDAKAAARNAVETLSVVDNLNLDNVIIQSLTTQQLKELVEKEQGDIAADTILSASRDAYRTIEQPVLNAIEAHPIIELNDVPL